MDYEFDISQLDAADTAEMTVMAFGRETSWKWIFAGPGHPKTVAQAERLARERLHLERMQEQARVNGRKYKAPEESVDEVRARNVNFILERLVGWNAVKMNGQDFPFTEVNAKSILADRRKIDVFNQAFEFLGGETSFMNRSASDSEPSPSVPSSSTQS